MTHVSEANPFSEQVGGVSPRTYSRDLEPEALRLDSSGQEAKSTAQHLAGLDARQWARSSPAERIQSLQRLEDHVAGLQGRRTRPVVQDPTLGEAYGQYGGSKDQLRLNPTLVGEGSTPYQAMKTTLHEGRHAYQWDAVNGLQATGTPEAEVQSWRDNYQPGAYNDPNVVSYEDYRFQPLEDDANRFATMFMESESPHFSRDPGYQRFLTDDADRTSKYEANATEAWGADFRESIAADVSARANEVQRGQGQGTQRGQGAQLGRGSQWGLAAQDGQGAPSPYQSARPVPATTTQQSQVNMSRARMSQPVLASEGVGRPVASQQVAWRGARTSVRGSSLGALGR